MQKEHFEFLIVGAGRGGTSLLAALLDEHGSLEVGFELFSVAFLMGRDLHCQDTHIFDRRVTAFISACEQEAKGYPNAIWGNKITTEQIASLDEHNSANPRARIDILDKLFNVYLENRKIIFILRDGRACVDSKVRRTGQSFELACQRWRYSVRVYKFLTNHHSDNLCIRFEDLLLHPERTLRDVCHFMEIPYQEQMLKGSNNKKILPEYRQNQIDTSKAASVDFPSEYLALIRDDLEYCDYLGHM